MSDDFAAPIDGFAALSAIAPVPMSTVISLDPYTAPAKPHEWWRGTLPTVPATQDWENVIQCVVRVEEGVSVVVLDGCASRALMIPAPGAPVFGMQVWLEGDAMLALEGGKPLKVSGGTALLFNHEQPVGWTTHVYAKRRVRMLDIRYTPEALARAGDSAPIALLTQRFHHDVSVPSHGSLVATLDAPASLLTLASEVSRDAPAAPEARRIWYRAKSLEMLAAFVQLLSAPLALQGPAAEERRQVQQACRLLRERCSEHWPPGRVARMVGLSERRLQELMREHVGRSVHAYLSDVRLMRASELLRSGMSVTQVAGDLGYSSLSHFSKIFKARYGASPRSW
ncbi:AraC family transcriptional regulator [Achromobacter mucicolens]|uniref:AraC family transcriptional regulator n=1 Tax=Achromobacter mucicolens TaxID=1389922 RepID=UPI0022F3D3E4|nr:AraC family transcriptional regulator [Achromobacter mucicolens]WBX87918.1 AraC family transcriptional regulator [Achromobacter mucicolens]